MLCSGFWQLHFPGLVLIRISMQNHPKFKFRCCIFEFRLLHHRSGFPFTVSCLCAGVFGTGRRQQYMSTTTTAAPRVGGHPPGDLGHGMQFAVCCCIFRSRSCALCGVWHECSVCAFASHSQCVCTVCDNITASFRFAKLNGN